MAAGVGSSSGSRAGERSGAVGGGVGAQKSGGNFGGNNAAGARGLNSGPYDTRPRNTRYDQSAGISAPATLGNIMGAIGMSPLGPLGPAGTIAGMAGVSPLGGISGPYGPSTNFSYDGPNKIAMGAPGGGGGDPSGVDALRQQWYAKLAQTNPAMGRLLQQQGYIPRGLMAPQAPAAPSAAMSLGQQTVPAATLGGPVPGLGNYQMQAPAYGYFGQPGQVRPPRAAMLGGY
jgi:hypothetical protein